MIKLNSDETAKPGWMPCPAVNIEYPGLAYIYPLDELIVVKQADAYHEIIGEKSSTGYTIFNNLGQKVFVAVEKVRCRRCHIKIFNNYGNEVLEIKRPFKLCKNRILIWAPAGNFVGVIKDFGRCVNTFTVKNWYGVVIMKLKAQGLFNVHYDMVTCEGVVVGRLANNWKVMNVNNFGMSFPKDMNVLDKAALVGACFFIGCWKYSRL